MFWKLLLTAAVIGLAWALLFRRPKARGRPRLPRPRDLVRCERCGVFHLPGRPCDCGRIGRD